MRLGFEHEQLDRTVLAACAATVPEAGWSEAGARTCTETGADHPLQGNHALTEHHKGAEQRVLANLLRLNLERAETRQP